MLPVHFLLALDFLHLLFGGFDSVSSSDTGQKGHRVSPPQRLLYENRSKKSEMGRKTESLHSLQSLICLRSSAKETSAEERRFPTRKHCTTRRVEKYYIYPVFKNRLFCFVSKVTTKHKDKVKQNKTEQKTNQKQ